MKRRVYKEQKRHIELTQGSIITNCVAEGFPNTKIWGVIITPRCDLARGGKVNTVHYLPMMNICDWFVKEGRKVLNFKWQQELKEKIKNQMRNWGINEDFIAMKMNYEQMMQIGDKYAKGKQKNDFSKLCQNYYTPTEEQFKEYICTSKNVTNYLGELKSNKIHNLYLLEDWEDNNNFKVILLRDIRRLQIGIANKFQSGFCTEDYDKSIIINNDLNYDSDESKFSGLYYIDAQILSPFVEHIMQSFSYNFTRIGVEDMRADAEKQLFEILKMTLAC